MSARSDALSISRLARLLASASSGMTTRAAPETAMPRIEPSGFSPSSRPPSDVATTYAHKRIRSTPEIRAAVRSMRSIPSLDRPWASNFRRRQRTTPLSSSTTESKPKAVRRTLRAAMPAPIASSASAIIHAMVTTSRRIPRSIAAPLAAAVATLFRPAGHQQHRAFGLVREGSSDVAEHSLLHAVNVVRADDYQVGAKLLGLVEDELRQLVGPMAAYVGRRINPRFRQLRGDF